MLQIFVMLLCIAQARVFKKMDIPDVLQADFNQIMDSADDMYQACLTRKEDLIDQKLVELQKSIQKAEQQTKLVGPAKTHLDRILNGTSMAVEKARGKHGEELSKGLKDTFHQLVQIAQIFKVEKVNIFFCNLDQTVWVQKDKKPQNPIHPREYRGCGKLVQ